MSNLNYQTRELSKLELIKNKDWSDREQRLSDWQAEFVRDREKVAGRMRSG